jgi:hypothetical protein
LFQDASKTNYRSHSRIEDGKQEARIDFSWRFKT